MNNPKQLASFCLQLMPGQIVFTSAGDREHLLEIAKISRSKSFGYKAWMFINAQGEVATVTDLHSSPSQLMEELESACARICGKNTDIFNPLVGQEAEAALHEALDSFNMESGEYTECQVQGLYTNERDGFTAFDNTTGDCWVEDFDTELQAVAYLVYDLSTSEELMKMLQS